MYGLEKEMHKWIRFAGLKAFKHIFSLKPPDSLRGLDEFFAGESTDKTRSEAGVMAACKRLQAASFEDVSFTVDLV